MLKHILPIIPQHTLYTEAFCGGAAVFFAKPPSEGEVIRCYDTPDTFHFVDPPYVGSDCGHYEGVFGESHLLALLDLLAEVKGKFMLTMFPDENIERYAKEHGWHIHRIERTISASKTSRRKQEEWMVCNYVKEEEPSLFD